MLFCFVYNTSVALPLEVKVAAHEPPVEPTHTVYNRAGRKGELKWERVKVLKVWPVHIKLP